MSDMDALEPREPRTDAGKALLHRLSWLVDIRPAILAIEAAAEPPCRIMNKDVELHFFLSGSKVGDPCLCGKSRRYEGDWIDEAARYSYQRNAE